MAKYRQKAIEVDAVRLEHRMLLQRPEGALSAEPGDYLETIRIGAEIHQRIVPARVFEATHAVKGKKVQEQEKPAGFSPEELGMVDRINSKLEAAMTCGEPHDGYPLTRE